MAQTGKAVYRRILLKLSGEALMGQQGFGIDPAIVARTAAEIAEVVRAGVQVGLVIGGGNIFRGVSLASSGLHRAEADKVGMLATLINSLNMQGALAQAGLDVRVMSALPMPAVCEDFVRSKAVRHLEKGRVVIFACGTGNPFFTTDTAASLRGIEIGAELVLKATKVDGVYSADPVKDASAVRYERLSYDEVLAKRLEVMDTTAIVLCRDHAMPLRVFNMTRPGALMNIMQGHAEGTQVEA